MESEYFGLFSNSRINCHNWTWRDPGADSDLSAHSGTFGPFGETKKYISIKGC